MSKPSEHKTVPARILEYAQAIGWSMVSREEAEKRRGDIPAPSRKKDGDRNVPAPVRTFNPRYAEASADKPPSPPLQPRQPGLPIPSHRATLAL
jgi:hypothetical protein